MTQQPVKLAEVPIDAEVRAAVDRVLASGKFIRGPESEALGREFAAFCGARFGEALCNGTAAVHAALHALGVGPGDEVIVPGFTFIATANPVAVLGAKPVFADVEQDYFDLDPAHVARLVSTRTKAIVPVHLYGQVADMGPLREIAEARGIALLEDACQSHGAEWQGKRTGTLADMAAFSFFPSKNLSVAGDGGAVVTNDPDLARRVARFKDAGRDPGAKYEHAEVGLNLRMSELHAAIGRVELKRLEAWVKRRRELAALYARELQGIAGLALPAERPGTKHAWHLYVVRHARRDALHDALQKEGIESGVHYPIPLHLQPALKGFARGPLPVSERLANEVLSLPVHPLLSDADVRRVAAAVRSWAGARA
jgi:dTDP-4-amino-4,6-dideoxygalactose transaminase